MKKFNSILIILILCICVVACGSHTEDQNQGKGNEPMEAPVVEQQQHKTENLRLLYRGKSPVHRFFGAEEGFYYLTESSQLAEELDGCHLMYMDYKTRREVYLCSDSGCRHNTDSCSSVLSAREFGSDTLIFVYNEQLYALSRDYDDDGAQSMDYLGAFDLSGEGGQIAPATKQPCLYRMRPDGSERKLFFTFPENVTVEDIIIEDGENLWFVTKEMTFASDGNIRYTSSQNRALAKFDVSQGKITDTISLDMGDQVTYKVVGAYGTKFVLSGMRYADGLTQGDADRLDEDSWMEMFKKSSTVFATIDVNSGEKKEIFNQVLERITSPGVEVADNYIFMGQKDGKGVIRIDVNTGEQAIFPTPPNDGIYCSLKDSICLWSDDASSGPNGDSRLIFVDIQTGEARLCPLTNISLGWPLQIMADAGDKVLVIYDYEADDLGDGAYEITKYLYGLISKDDLYSGKGNFEPIEMIGKGR